MTDWQPIESRDHLLAEAAKLEARALELRRQAKWGDDAEYGAIAEKLLYKWLSDPDMWATHGMPGDAKLARIEQDIAAAFRTFANKPTPT